MLSISLQWNTVIAAWLSQSVGSELAFLLAFKLTAFGYRFLKNAVILITCVANNLICVLYAFIWTAYNP